ncbi:Zinc finger CCHC-type [Carpediemonas membranifera]|uniref:Zinc finger CCHC-type n=1 Tax=Carpediemonas membranifera TaxID=201153 RepID=A0A8J6B4I8_9EUKA|nr:Zinc finger CCHC-type [Carpediemonas membranifera]|eukprot:KAG9392747.1 Zinc finger CCHC-type [Carpediemonas membranifera]
MCVGNSSDCDVLKKIATDPSQHKPDTRRPSDKDERKLQELKRETQLMQAPHFPSLLRRTGMDFGPSTVTPEDPRIHEVSNTSEILNLLTPDQTATLPQLDKSNVGDIRAKFLLLLLGTFALIFGPLSKDPARLAPCEIHVRESAVPPAGEGQTGGDQDDEGRADLTQKRCCACGQLGHMAWECSSEKPR